MTVISPTAVVSWDPELSLNPAPVRAELAGSLPMFSLDVVGVIAGYLLFTKYVWCGQQTWENLFGAKCIDGVVPVYPREVEKELARDCPFNAGMQVWQTHFLMLFVGQIHGMSMSIKNIPDVFESAHGVLDQHAERRKLLKYCRPTTSEDGEPTTYWGLVIRGVPGTEGVPFAQQEKFIQARGGKNYQLLPGHDFAQYEFMQYILTGQFPPSEILRCRKQKQWITLCVSTLHEHAGIGFIGYTSVKNSNKIPAAAVRAFPQSQEKL